MPAWLTVAATPSLPSHKSVATGRRWRPAGGRRPVRCLCCPGDHCSPSGQVEVHVVPLIGRALQPWFATGGCRWSQRQPPEGRLSQELQEDPGELGGVLLVEPVPGLRD